MIYLDSAATTPVRPEVWDAMRPCFSVRFGNPSSAHTVGRKARQALEDAREQIAQLMDAFPDEVIFTSGATEANNLAIFGLAGSPPGLILSSTMEHPCVVEPTRQLAHAGFTVAWDIWPDDPTDLRLVCRMLVNHETGAIAPIQTLVSQVPAAVAFHCDAAQAVGKMPVRFHELGVTTLTASGHKFHAPPGIGFLLLRRGAKLTPQLWGGHQQQGRRPGTESVALAVGMAKALELAHRDMEKSWSHLRNLRERFLERLQAEAMPCIINSPTNENIASPYLLNIAFPDCRADVLLMKLDLAGIACSTGSACSSGSLLPSPVLQTMGVSDAVLRSAMRFSFDTDLTLADIDEASRLIVQAIKELRDL